MIITRAIADAEVLLDAGPYLALVGLGATSAERAAALDAVMRAGFAAVGLGTSTWVPADADFALVLEGTPAEPPAPLEILLAVAKLAALDLVLSRWNLPDVKQNNSAQDWGALYAVIVKRAETRRRELAALRGDDVATLGVGSIALGILDPVCADAEDPGG